MAELIDISNPRTSSCGTPSRELRAMIDGTAHLFRRFRLTEAAAAAKLKVGARPWNVSAAGRARRQRAVARLEYFEADVETARIQIDVEIGNFFRREQILAAYDMAVEFLRRKVAAVGDGYDSEGADEPLRNVEVELLVAMRSRVRRGSAARYRCRVLGDHRHGHSRPCCP